jgi:hypothetical protein
MDAAAMPLVLSQRRPSPGAPEQGVRRTRFRAVTPDGKHVYVVNFNSNNVSVIDTASNMVRWGLTPLRSPSPRMGNVPMSRTQAPQAPSR